MTERASHASREQTVAAVCSLCFLTLLLVVALLCACAGTGPAPVPDAPDASTDHPAAAIDAIPPPIPVTVNPAWTRRARADSLFDAGSYDAALPELEACREDPPGDYRLDMRVAWIHFDRGHYDDAISTYRDAVDANPKSVDARVGLAKSYEKAGRNDSAIHAYDKAIDVHGLDRRIAPLVVAQANLLNNKGRHDRALALIEESASVFELTAGLHCAYGMALAGEGRFDEAVEAFAAATGDAQYADFARAQIQRIDQLRGR